MSTDVNSLAEPLRSSVIGLIAEAGGRVGISSARRTTDEQIALRRKNCGQSDYDIWQKPSDQCNPETARPETSKHEDGTAVDLSGDLALAKQLAPKYSMVAPLPKEPWHFVHTSAAGGVDPGDGPGSGATYSGGVKLGSVGDLAKTLPGAVAGALVPDAITDTAGAAVAVARALLDPKTWLRGVAIAGGAVLVVVGLVIIAVDIGAPTPPNPIKAARSVAANRSKPDALDVATPASSVKGATA